MSNLSVVFRVLVVSILLGFSSFIFAENLPQIISPTDKPASAERKAEKTHSGKHKKGGAKKSEISSAVNINSATAEEINAGLFGIGPSKAKAIVEYREKHGKFAKAEDLKNVKGIGDAIIEKNKAKILLN